MANDEMTTLSVAETDNDSQKNAQALERLLQSMFDASNPKSRTGWLYNQPVPYFLRLAAR